MRIKHIIYAVLTMSLVSCEKDFLDKQPSEFLSPEQVVKAGERDPSLLNGNLLGVYAFMYQAGGGGTEDHDDFGQKGYDIYSDMIASDMVLGALNYGWYSTLSRYQSTTDFTRIDAYKPWRFYYQVILGANTLIDGLGGNDAVPTVQENKWAMGQAKGLRAYAYFYLAQFYSKGYGDGTAKILPIYTDTKVSNQPLSTTKQVYDLIIDDLTESVTLLEGFNRSAGSKTEIDKYVAEGLLSYAYAARGGNEDLAKVILLTDDVILNSGLRLNNQNEVVAVLDANGAVTNPQAGFNNVNNPSWMWGADLTLASNLDLISWWGQVDLFTYSYAWAGDPKVMDAGLFAKIKPTDSRKGQFDTRLRPRNKFFDPARVIGGQRNVTTDYVYMRMEEMYLLNAEAKAKLNQDGLAIVRLKELLTKRMPDASYVDALSGQALDDEIYLQTRIELWGEGKSYLAMKRNKATITRGTNSTFFAGQSFPYDDDRLTFPIPQAEIINNPEISRN